VAVAMDLGPAADDAAVVDHRIAPDRDVVTDPGLFPDNHVMAGLEAAADDRTRVDHRSASQASAFAQRGALDLGAQGRVADDDAVVGNEIRGGACSSRHHATATAVSSFNAAQTRSIWLVVIPGNSGKVRISCAAASTTGSGPSA